MTVYICDTTVCPLRVKCFHTHVRPVGEVHVTHFRPQGEFSCLCPHYMEWTGDGD